MPVANDTPNPKRRSKTRLALLFLPIWLPLLACTAFEWFIDPFPNSIWLLRVLNTKYLVHVRADLTIDGEPLVMERTFRCFEPVDYHWFPGSFRKGNVLSSNGQAGDTMAATTSNGRLFVINATDACSVLIDLKGPYRKPPPIIENPLKLSRGELDVPIVHELIGGIYPTQVDTYIVREWLLQGYHGVQVNDVTVQKVSRPFYKDWNGYDSFGPLNWARVNISREGFFDHKYAVVLPEYMWGRSTGHATATSERVAQLIGSDLEILKSGDAPRQLQKNNYFELLLGQVDIDTPEYNFAAPRLRLPRINSLKMRAEFSWLTKLITPCTVANSESVDYICDSAKLGIVSSQPRNRIGNDVLTFRVDGLELKTDRFEGGYYVANNPLRAIIFDNLSLGFVSRR